MTMHVICLNPAIDKLYVIDGFEAGEDYPGQRPVVRIGGKGVNAARVLSQLGMQVHLYALLGEDSEPGFRREMEPRCRCTFIPVPGACRTTVNIIDSRNGRETVITESGPQVEDSHVRRLMEELEADLCAGDCVLLSGSVIAGAPKDIYAAISRLAQRKGARCALDCNAKALPASLENAHYALGKPNERELCALLGQERTDEPEKLIALARTLLGTYDALLISMGAKGGLWVDAGQAWLARMPEIPVVSTVGSGDAAFAGAMAAIAQGMDAADALHLAMACGAANAILGEVGSVRPEDVREMMKRIIVTKVST